MSALDVQLRKLERAANATPDQRAALAELAIELAAGPPAPCPRCGGAMGDGDRVTAGVCAVCRRGRGR